MIRALDDLKSGEAHVEGGASPTYGLWGDLMRIRAKRLVAASAVLVGFSRDTSEIRSLRSPTFSYAGCAQNRSSRGTIIDHRSDVALGNTTVTPGNVVFGDLAVPGQDVGDSSCISEDLRVEW